MTKIIRIAKGLSLPQDTVTQTMVVYGGKGMGKTNFGSVLVEELAAAGHRFSVLDPVGVWWGLQYAADGKGPGLEVLILGGKHGDIPIEPKDGVVVADLVADEEADVIIDISRRKDGRMWSLGDRIRFMTDYCIRLYERQGERRRPLHQVIDEAGRFCPQTIPHGSLALAACVGAIERMVEEGRNVGIGVTLITQRSARMNKSVSELADCMLAFRTVGPRSVDAILDWFGEHVEKPRWKELVEQLRSLPRGTALVVSPGWLEFEGVAEIRPRKTFDSSSTPTGGGERKATGKAAKPDLAAYRARMSETLERAKADDPKQLKQRIAVLEKELRDRPKGTVLTTTKATPPLNPSTISTLRAYSEQVDAVFGKQLGEGIRIISDCYRQLTAGNAGVKKVIAQLERHSSGEQNKAREQKPASIPLAAFNRAPSERHVKGSLPHVQRGNADSTLPRPRQRILDALAWLESVGRRQGTHAQVAFLAEASPRSSSFQNNVSGLRSAGLVDYPSPGSSMLTAEGRALAAAIDRPATPETLHEALAAQLPAPQMRILRVLIDCYPEQLTKEQLADQAEASAASSSFQNNVSALRSLGFLDYPRSGSVVATPLLFLEA